MPPFLQWIFSMSVFRWGIEAFYINEIKFYADYLDVDDRLNYYGYDLDNFATDIGAILLINLFYVVSDFCTFYARNDLMACLTDSGSHPRLNEARWTKENEIS